MSVKSTSLLPRIQTHVCARSLFWQAWSRSQSLVRKVWASRSAESHAAEKKEALMESFKHEPSQQELDRIIGTRSSSSFLGFRMLC